MKTKNISYRIVLNLIFSLLASFFIFLSSTPATAQSDSKTGDNTDSNYDDSQDAQADQPHEHHADQDHDYDSPNRPWTPIYKIGYSADTGTDNQKDDQISGTLKWRRDMKLYLYRSTSKSDLTDGTTVTTGLKVSYNASDKLLARALWSNAIDGNNGKTTTIGIGTGYDLNSAWNAEELTTVDLDFSNQQYYVPAISSGTGYDERFAGNTFSIGLTQELVLNVLSANINASKTNYPTKISTITTTTTSTGTTRRRRGNGTQVITTTTSASAFTGYPDSTTGAGLTLYPISSITINSTITKTKYADTSTDDSTNSVLNIDWDISDSWSLNVNGSKGIQGDTNTSTAGGGITYIF